MEQLFNDNEKRGQVGIGTLIVFIAMVLVAAIAAGVLINTAGFLQTQAEDTGEQSTDQVADNLNVITEVGTVNFNDSLNEVRVGVQPAAGADDINLADLTIQYVSDSGFENLVVGNDTAGGSGEQAAGDTDPSSIYLNDLAEANYLIDLVKAENPGDVVMTDSSDRYELVIPLDASAGSWGEVASGGPASETASPSGDLSYGQEITLSAQSTIVELNSVTDGSSTDFTEDFTIKNTGSGGETPSIVFIGEDGTGYDTSLTIEYEYLSTGASYDQSSLVSLEEGEQAELTITTDVGSQTVAYLQVPDSLSGDSTGDTVNL